MNGTSQSQGLLHGFDHLPVKLHVQKMSGQSTNDSYPTSAKLACILMHSELLNAIKLLSRAALGESEGAGFHRWM